MSSDWDELLDPDERIIWQGQPSGKLRLEITNPFAPLFLIVLISFPVYSLLTNPIAEEIPALICVVVIGCWGLVGIPVWAAYKRNRTAYALTNTRALIRYRATPSAKVSSFPITPQTLLTLDEGRARSVWFGPDLTKKSYSWKHYKNTGFELIDDPRAVYQYLRQIQQGEI